MPKVLGSTTGRVVAGVALMGGLVSVLTGSAAAASPSQPAQTVRPVSGADLPRQERPAPRVASRPAVGVANVTAASVVRAPRVAVRPPAATVRRHAARATRPTAPTAHVGGAVAYIRLPDGTVVRVR